MDVCCMGYGEERKSESSSPKIVSVALGHHKLPEYLEYNLCDPSCPVWRNMFLHSLIHSFSFY